jgi:hypothetical protein
MLSWPNCKKLYGNDMTLTELQETVLRAAGL